MGTFWSPRNQEPSQQDTQGSQNQPNYITADDLAAFVRSNQFRSIMRNQNADLYETGQWENFDGFEVFQSSFPFSSSSAVNAGTGATKSGRYTRIGDTVVFTFAVRFGSGFPGITGALCFNLPVQPPISPQFGEFPPFGAGTSEILPVVLGDIFVYGGLFNDAQAVGWLRAVLRTDPVTGASLNPARFFIAKGLNGEVDDELWSNGMLLGTASNYGDTIFPGDGSIITGRLVYEAAPPA
jgi:hypothetical protein